MRWGSPLCVALRADRGCLQPSQPLSSSKPGLKMNLAEASPFKCLPDFTNSLLLFCSHWHPAQHALVLVLPAQALALLASTNPWCHRLDSLGLTCLKQRGKTLEEKLCVPKSAGAKIFEFSFLPGAALFSLEELHAIASCKIMLIFYLPTSIVTRIQSRVETPFEGVYW